MLFCYRFSFARSSGHVNFRDIENLINTKWSMRFSFCGCYHTLISTSTPLGSSNFIRASMVFDEEL